MGFFATFWVWLNGQLATYIGTNTARLAAVLEPAVVTLATLYVMVWGYLHLTGQIEEPFVAGLKRIIILAVILGVGLRLWLYNTAHRRHVLQRAGRSWRLLSLAPATRSAPSMRSGRAAEPLRGILWVKGAYLPSGFGFVSRGRGGVVPDRDCYAFMRCF